MVEDGTISGSDDRFRALADVAPFGVFRTRADGGHVYGNPALHEILGVTEAELTATGWAGLVHPEDRDRTIEEFGQAVELGVPTHSEMRMCRPDGSIRWVVADASPFTDAEGVMAGIVGTLVDRTEEHLAEERRRVEDERFLLAFTHSASPMWVTGLQGEEAGRTVEVNPAMCEMLQVDRRDIVGRPSVAHIDPADRHAVSSAVAEAIRAGGSVSRDVRMRRADGSTFWANYLIGVAHGSDGDPRYVVGHLRDVSASRSDRMRLTTMATTDPLTGIANRNLLLERMAEGIEDAHRTGSGLAVLFLDLDRFKLINDSLGHRIGDDLLRAVARRLEGAVRRDDTLARLGGDEFVVLCRWVTGADHAARVADRLRACFSEPFDVGGRRLHVGASIGISLLGPGSTDPTTLIEAADTALYRAKENGRSRIEVYSDDLRRQAEERLRTEDLIRWALEEDRLRLHAQPVFETRSLECWGQEALVRIEGPDGELVPPGEWLPTAEASGLIDAVGDWVLRRAVDVMAGSEGAGVMCVNVSGRQLSDTDLAGLVEEQLDRAGIPGERLVLEMTESVLLDAGSAVGDGLERLRRRGVRIALDDFGTGYSSLSYLTSLPVDIVKIDRSFVVGLGTDPGRTAVAEAVIALASRLGMATVAEGIETEEQLAAVRELGCDLVQGFLLGRPADTTGTGLTRAGTPPS